MDYHSDNYREQLIQEYDAYFKLYPKKWASNQRDIIAVEVIKSLNPNPIDILDVGCGNGHLLQMLEKAFPKTRLYGLDISPEALKIAADFSSPSITFTEGFIEDLPEIDKYSVVILQGTIEHLVDPAEALLKIKSILRNKGILYIEAPNNLAYSPGEHTYRRLKVGSKQMEWHLCAKEWEAIFTSTGFRILKYRKEYTHQWGNIWALTPAEPE